MHRSLFLCCKYLIIILPQRTQVVWIHYHWFRSFNFTDYVSKKKLFLLFPDSDDFVSQPLNALKNRNEKQKFIWPQGSSYLVNRYESQRFSCTKFNSNFICFSWLKLAITIITTLLSPGLIIMWACSLEACFTWTKILSSTSSILHCIKDHISRAALLVTTY